MTHHRTRPEDTACGGSPESGRTDAQDSAKCCAQQVFAPMRAPEPAERRDQAPGAERPPDAVRTVQVKR
jgi:hypothetical protein